jgi:hypothetical protein
MKIVYIGVSYTLLSDTAETDPFRSSGKPSPTRSSYAANGS